MYITGYVVANDKFKELSKSIVIADQSGGIELLIECDNINSLVPLFSKVRLRCTGLNIGRIGAKTIIGGYPTADYVVDRIDEHNIFNYLEIIDHGTKHPQPEKLTIEEISPYTMLRYVAVHNLQLIAEERGKCWCDNDTTSYNRYVTTVRHFTSGNDTLRIVTHQACSYASQLAPKQPCTIHGVVDWHDGDIALRITANQFSEDSSAM